jgi:hypothetical protein
MAAIFGAGFTAGLATAISLEKQQLKSGVT